MLKFSKKVEYALIAMVNMDGILERGELVSAKSLSAKFNIPPDIMGKVLQTLVRNGLLESVQGMKGGYTISRPLDNITVLEIIEAIDGRISLTSCIKDEQGVCSQYDYCGIQTPIGIIQNELVDMLSNISLLDVKDKSTLYLKEFES